MTGPPEPDRLLAAYPSLRRLRDETPRLFEALAAPLGEAERGWMQILDTRILPRLSPSFPLIAAITGGGSSGKSTLFNSLVGRAVSTAGGRAGLNRRVLVGVHPDAVAEPGFLTELFRPFGADPVALADRAVLTTQGPPVYAACDTLPRRVILLDTPDFDVGQGGRYLNRGVAEPVLTAADVLVYIFTNATYNAKANTDFIREQLTRIGRRPCVLVYRCYASFTDADVRAHTATVAENLYGADWRDHVMAVYRADDDNQVASGASPAQLRPLDGDVTLLEALEALDPRDLRREQNTAMVRDVVGLARTSLAEAGRAADALRIYRDVLRLAESQQVAAALKHVPLAAIVERIREIFERTDSGFVRFSRRAGRVTGAPFRGLMKLVNRRAEREAEEAKVDPVELTRNALTEAAATLRRQALASEVSAATTPGDPDGAAILSAIAGLREQAGVIGDARPFAEVDDDGASNVFVAAPPRLAGVRRHLGAERWSQQVEAFGEAAAALMELPDAFDSELEQIVRDFREEMPWWKKARAALVGSLNLLPPVIGVVYVFATVDPVGGSTLSAKLGSVFGMHDLWATVSIPASSGLDDATRAHLKKLLDPVVQRWLASRAEPVGQLFRQHITGPLIDGADAALAEAEPLHRALVQAVDAVSEAAS